MINILMSFEDNSKQANEHFVSSIVEINDLDAQSLQNYNKEELEQIIRRLVEEFKKVKFYMDQLVDKCDQFEQQNIGLRAEKEDLEEHINIVTEENRSLRCMMDQLEQSKQMRIQQISLSEQQLKNTCLEMSAELQNHKEITSQLILSEKELMSKIRELQNLQQYAHSCSKMNQVQDEMYKLKKQIEFLNIKLEKTQNDLNSEKQDNFKFREDLYTKEERIEELTYLLQQRQQTQPKIYKINDLQPSNIQPFQSQYQEPNITRNLSHQEIFHVEPSIKRQGSQHSLIRERKSTIQGGSKIIMNKKQGKYSSTSRKELSHKNTESSVSLFDGFKGIQNKEVRLLKKENKGLKKKNKEMEDELLHKMDMITQLEGQLELKEDSIFEIQQELLIRKVSNKKNREELYRERLEQRAKFYELQTVNHQLEQQNSILKNNYESLQNKLNHRMQQEEKWITNVFSHEELSGKQYLHNFIESKIREKEAKKKIMAPFILPTIQIFGKETIHKAIQIQTQKQESSCQTGCKNQISSYLQMTISPTQKKFLSVSMAARPIVGNYNSQTQSISTSLAINTQNIQTLNCESQHELQQHSDQENQYILNYKIQREESSFNHDLISEGQCSQNHEVLSHLQQSYMASNHEGTSNYFNSPQNHQKNGSHSISTYLSPESLSQISVRERFYPKLRGEDDLKRICEESVEESYNNSASKKQNIKNYDILPQISQQLQLLEAQQKNKDNEQNDNKNYDYEANLENEDSQKIISTENEHQINLAQQNMEYINHLIPKNKRIGKILQKDQKQENWREDKLYICKAKIIELNLEDEIVLWNTGLVSLALHKSIVMKKKKKQIIAKNMKIFGNCEVRVEEDKIYCRRYGKKNYYEGNLPDYTWKVQSISSYTFE